MKKYNLVLCSFLSSAGVLVYVMLVAFIMNNGERTFDKAPQLLAVTLLLTLFVISAAITSTLVFGGPVWFYLQKKQKEAIKMLFLNITWLIIMAFGVMTVLFLK